MSPTLTTFAAALLVAAAAHADPAAHVDATYPGAAASADPASFADPAPPVASPHAELAARLGRAAHAEPTPRGPLRLTTTPCAADSGAELRCGRASILGRAPRPISYFEAHSRLVMRDMISFNHSYTLEYLRERDELRLYGPVARGPGGVADGIALFSTVVVGAAHMPGRGRVLFDHRVHLGPALFDGGGMGAGVGARL